VGDTISITEIAAVPVNRLAGIVCRHGSALSHMAVLARALEVPAVVSLSSLPASLLEGHTIVVDGDQGRVDIQPSHLLSMRSTSTLQSARQPPNGSRHYGTCRLKHWTGFGLPLHANIGWSPISRRLWPAEPKASASIARNTSSCC